MTSRFSPFFFLGAIPFLFGTLTASFSHAGGKASSGWIMFGGTPQRNMVNLTEKNVITDWSVESNKNVKWVVDLGTKSYGGPVIADGKVFVGTNNARPRDPKVKGETVAVLMAFNEADGKFLWQITHDIPNTDTFHEVIRLGLLSTPIVEGRRLYYVTPSAEVICAATTDGKILWRYDMMKSNGVLPFHCANCSPLLLGDRLFLVTGNGNHEGKIVDKAPSFIALNKTDGKLAWQSNLPGKKILEGQWSNPALAMVKGKPQLIFPGGDNAVYGLEPETGNMIWKCGFNFAKPAEGDDEPPMQNYMIGTPVVHEDRVYFGLGHYPDHPTPTRNSHVLCLDITRTGDVSAKSFDAKAPENKNSALVWSFGGPVTPTPKKGRRVWFGSTMSTPAVHGGLVYIPEDAGYLHCLDAKSGERHWFHDFKTSVWGSPLYVDGKVYIGAEDGTVAIFKSDKTYQKPATHDMMDNIQGSPVVANGVLYVTTANKLYALAEKK